MRTSENVTCNNCGWSGHEDDLYLVEFDVNDENETPTAYIGRDGMVNRIYDEPKNRDFLNGCPKCLTDGFLMDID